MDDNNRVRPRKPTKAQLDKPEKIFMGKKFIGPLMPEQERAKKMTLSESIAGTKRVEKGLQKVRKLGDLSAIRNEKIDKRIQRIEEKKLKRLEILMARQAKKEEIAQAVENLKILRQELKRIK